MRVTTFKTRDLKKEFQTPYTNDIVHRSLKLCPLSKAIMSTPQMQRLKQLKQLGVCENLYTCTTHNRFQHSLGVMMLCEELLKGLKERQPKLGITEKDIVCVKIAGLLHDIGHGPYSHVYDGVFRQQLKKAEKAGMWLGRKFDTSSYKDLDNAMDGWAHEDASLMMIDAMLKDLGLEIDSTNLDAPLKQIGDGIDGKCFGIWDRSAEPDVILGEDSDYESDDGEEEDAELIPLSTELVLTSRDWLFIKECISGGPLPPKGMSIKKFKESNANAKLIGRPHPFKEFLYDVVANRHSGLDTDKMDYLARDILHAHASNIADLLPKLSEKAFVAWGECPNPSGCWKCRQNHSEQKKSVANDRPGMHIMICYPDSMVQNIMSFFEKRFEEHQRTYTHGKNQASNYMICDILLLAEPYFSISAMNDGKDMFAPDPPVAAVTKLPISRAMVNPDTYLELTDSVLDKIMNTDRDELRSARILIKRYRSHEIYKRIRSNDGDAIGDEPWQQKLWNMDEAEIIDEILKRSEHDMADDDDKTLKRHDIIIEKRKIHHGMKEKNPVNFMRFLPKGLQRQLLNSPANLPTARQIPEASYRKPDTFQQKNVRVYSRSVDKAKLKQLAKCYEDFIGDLQAQESENERNFSVEFEYVDDLPQTPSRSTTRVMAGSPPCISQSPNKDDEDEWEPPSNKRQRHSGPGTLFARVTKQSN
mmetsp:Transcript_8531/g.18453  ORF Transcript_8531/g.18453 Transcript_8531/m.18453 type:complete len:701 (-) Transcript_8531:93-2195(-)